MRKILVLAALAAAIAFARPADAQTLQSYSLIDSAQHNFLVANYRNSTTGFITPASVSSDASGNPLAGIVGLTNPNGTALFVQGVTNGVPVLTSFSAPQHIICDSGCGGGGGGGLSIPFAGAIGANGTPVGFKDGSGNFQPLLGDVTNGQWVNIKASVPIAVTGTFFQATQPISAASLPLPAGAATQTTLASILTALGTPFQAGGSIGNTAFVANAGTNLNTSLLALETGGNLASINTKTPALGQALATGSVPVVLTAAQLSTLTPLTSVTVVQGTGTNLHVVCDSGCSSSSSPTFGSTFPTTGTPIGMSQGGNLVALTGTGGSLNVNITGGGAGGTSSNFAAAFPTSGTAIGLTNGTNMIGWSASSNYGTSPGAIAVPAVNASITNTVAVTLASTTVTGTVAVTQSTSPWIVAGGGTAGAPGTAVLTIQGVVNGTNVPTSHASGSVVSGAYASGSIASGAYASGSIGAGAVAAGAYVSGSVLSGAFASGSLVDITNVSGPLAAATATATKAVIVGAQFLTTQPTITTTQQASLLTTNRGELLVSPGASGFAVTMASTTITGTVAATQSGNWTSRIVGNAGGLLDAIGQNVTAPANWLQAGCQFNTSPTTITSGNGSPLQCTNAGAMLVSVSNTNANIVPGDGITTTAYGAASPTIGVGLLWNGTTYDRQKSVSTGVASVGVASGGIASGAIASGAAVSGAFASGALVDVTNFTGAPASAPPSKAAYLGANASGATGGQLKGLITCDNHIFRHITTATDTLAVQGVASQTIYVCGWRSRAAGTATWFLENTASVNANCSSTNTQLNGLASETANTGEVTMSPFWNGFKNTSGNGLCINSTGTGGVDIDIWYAQL